MRHQLGERIRWIVLTTYLDELELSTLDGVLYAKLGHIYVPGLVEAGAWAPTYMWMRRSSLKSRPEDFKPFASRKALVAAINSEPHDDNAIAFWVDGQC